MNYRGYYAPLCTADGNPDKDETLCADYEANYSGFMECKYKYRQLTGTVHCRFLVDNNIQLRIEEIESKEEPHA
jgi:hypothetical protein